MRIKKENLMSKTVISNPLTVKNMKVQKQKVVPKVKKDVVAPKKKCDDFERLLGVTLSLLKIIFENINISTTSVKRGRRSKLGGKK